MSADAYSINFGVATKDCRNHSSSLSVGRLPAKSCFAEQSLCLDNEAICAHNLRYENLGAAEPRIALL